MMASKIEVPEVLACVGLVGLINAVLMAFILMRLASFESENELRKEVTRWKFSAEISGRHAESLVESLIHSGCK